MRRLAYACGAVLLGLSACDDASSSPDADPVLPDAAPVDDGGGEQSDAPVAATLTVIAHDDGGDLLAGAPVVVHHPDGTVKSTTVTGANGVAEPEVEAGDLLSVGVTFVSEGTERHVVTFFAVKPGDVLRVGEPSRGSSMIGTMTVTGPGVFAGAVGYEASSSRCEGSFNVTGASFAYDLYSDCHPDPSKAPVLLIATDVTDTRVAYAVDDEVAIVGSAGQATLSAWRTDFLPFSSTVTNVAESASVDRLIRLIAATGELFELKVSSVPAFTDLASTVVPMDLAPHWIYSEQFDDGDNRRSRVLGGDMPIPTAVATDFATELLASVGPISHDAIAPARLITTWSYLADGATGHDGVVVAHFVEQTGSFGTWTLVLPPGTTTATLPVLPESMAAYRPTVTPFSTDVTVIESSVLGYDQLRGTIHGPVFGDEALLAPLLPAAGSGSALLSERTLFTGE